MKILSIELAEKDVSFCVWIEQDGFYKKLVINNRDEITMHLSSVPVSDYKDYDHFWQVMGKFNPYVDFLIKPREVEFTYDALEQLMIEIRKENREEEENA